MRNTSNCTLRITKSTPKKPCCSSEKTDKEAALQTLRQRFPCVRPMPRRGGINARLAYDFFRFLKRPQYQSAQRKLRLGVSTVSRPAGEQAIPVWQQKRNVRVAQPIARGWMPVAVRARRDPIRARRPAASVGASAIATQKTGARRPKTIHTQSPQSGPVSSIANCSTSARIASLPSCAVRVSASTTRRSVPARTPVTRPTASSNSCG